MSLPTWIVTDLDETLLHNDRTISERSLDAIAKMREMGIRFAIATTRSKDHAQPYLDILAPDAMVLSGGAVGYMAKELIYERPLEDSHAHRLFSLFDGTRTVENFVVDTPSGRLSKEMVSSGGHPDTVYSMFVWVHEGRSISEIDDESGDALYTLLWEPRMYRISHRKATKAEALRHMLGDVAPDSVLCFGDDLMDIGMLRHFHGVAVANAKQEAKRAARAITLSNEEDGVAFWLERLQRNWIA